MSKEYGAADHLHLEFPKNSPHAAALLRHEEFHPAPDTISIERRKDGLRQKVKKGIAIVSATAAIGGMAAPAARAESSSAKASRHEVATKFLRDPRELPGLRVHLGRETLQKIKASTVEIGSRRSIQTGGSAEDPYRPGCTAVKVSIPGQKGSYIMTAAHCLAELTGVTSGAFTDTANPYNRAENFTKLSPFQFGVLDPSASFNERIAHPSAIVDRISIDTDNKDVAMLHAVAAPLTPKAALNVRRFNEIPAIPLRVAEKAPLQGTPVALYGEPQANNFEPIAGAGVYLGRVSYSYDQYPDSGGNHPAVYRQMDLVGIFPSNTQEDNCNYGTSGSMALLPNGELLGNLTLRSNSGYGPSAKIQLPDNIDFDNYWRPIWEQELNVNLREFVTLCGYTVMDANTPYDLIEGFNHPAPTLGK